MARRLADAIIDSPALERMRRQSEEFAAAVHSHSRRTANRYAEQFARTMAPAIAARNEQFVQAARAFSASAMAAGYTDGFRLDVSRLNVDAVLASPFDALPAEQREWARRVVDEATAHVDDTTGDLDEELLDTLADTARTFASSQPAGLSWAAQKKLFIAFWAILVFTVLVQAQVESEMAKELLEDAGGAMLVVSPLLLGAGWAWDKMNPDPGADESEDDDTT
jgi:hypothetical protein